MEARVSDSRLWWRVQELVEMEKYGGFIHLLFGSGAITLSHLDSAISLPTAIWAC